MKIYELLNFWLKSKYFMKIISKGQHLTIDQEEVEEFYIGVFDNIFVNFPGFI